MSENQVVEETYKLSIAQQIFANKVNLNSSEEEQKKIVDQSIKAAEIFIQNYSGNLSLFDL